MRHLYLMLQLMVALTTFLTHADTLSTASIGPQPASTDISNYTVTVTTSEATRLPIISTYRIKTFATNNNNTAANDILKDNSDYYADNSARNGALQGFATLDKEVVDQLIKEWAPVVWLAPEEKFMPLGVEEFLNHVHPSDRDRSFIPGMPFGDDSKKAFLVTNAQIDELLENENSFIFGRNPNKSPVPIYAVVKLCNDQPNKVDSPKVSITLTTPTPSPTPPSTPSTPPMPQTKDQFEPSSPAFSTRGPYIPVSFNPLDERIYTVRRSSRLYPVFKRIRRNAAAKPETARKPLKMPLKTATTKSPIRSYELVMGEMNVGGTANIVDINLATTAPHEVNGAPVNNFIANLADNVKFSPPTDDLDNNINFESSYNEPIRPETSSKQQKLPSFHVTYWMFYPYSQGKTMCTLSLGPLGSIPFPAVYGFCLGRRKDIGSHIGDWEHMSLFFSSGTEPSAMYVSAHDAGAYYTYNRLTGSFEFQKQETRKGILQRPNFPKTVTTFNNHPVLFAAKGSHGLWTAPGKHRFVKVARLYDINGFGTPWNTWNAIDITYENRKSFGRSLMHSWLSFKGKWGNPKSKCHPFRRIGLNFCEYTDGPTGIPLKEPHFECGVAYR